MYIFLSLALGDVKGFNKADKPENMEQLSRFVFNLKLGQKRRTTGGRR